MPEEQKENEIKEKKINQTISESQEEQAAREQNFRYPGKILCIEK